MKSCTPRCPAPARAVAGPRPGTSAASPLMLSALPARPCSQLRAFRNRAGFLRPDQRRGSDSWAVGQGWVAVTPVGLRSDVPLSARAAAAREDERLVAALAAAMQAAAKALGCGLGGLEGVRQQLGQPELEQQL